MFIIVKKIKFNFFFDFDCIPFKSSDCLCTKLFRLKYFFISRLKSFEVTNISFENEYINLKKIFSNY